MADAGQQIGFEQIGIANVLRTYWLQVPLNQREYSWEDAQVKRLFHDISDAILQDAPAYFLGNIVTINAVGLIGGAILFALTLATLGIGALITIPLMLALFGWQIYQMYARYFLWNFAGRYNQQDGQHDLGHANQMRRHQRIWKIIGLAEDMELELIFKQIGRGRRQRGKSVPSGQARLEKRHCQCRPQHHRSDKACGAG